MTTAVILNLQHAERFARAKMSVGKVVSFCPTATAYLRERGYEVMSTAETYKAFSHARVVVKMSRDLPQLTQAATRHYSLDAEESEGLKIYLYHYLACVYHFHYALRHLRGEPLVWVNGNEVQQGPFDTMFTSLAQQPTPIILSYAYSGYSYAHYLLAACYNKITSALIRMSERLKVIDYGDELPKRITAAMEENGEKLLLIHTHRVGKNALITTRFFLKSLWRLMTRSAGAPVYLFRATNPAEYDALTSVPASKSFVHDVIPFIRAEVAIGRKLVRACRPHIAVSDHAKYGYILGGLAEMAGYGGKHAMINHGTHTAQHAPLSKMAAKLWGEQGRIINANTSHSLPKSPLTAALLKDIRPSGYHLSKINVYGKITRTAGNKNTFIILQAGNYTDAFNHIPWCKETSDEYLLATLELVEEVGKLENVELIVKLKPKKSRTHQAVVQAHIDKLGIGQKVRVDTTSRFSDLMARADLVVCNLSGTIEEALANHIPLMVHTYRKTYFHIPCAPAHLVKEKSDIARIITQLQQQHGRAEDIAVYDRVTWPQDELTTLSDFAKKLVRDA